MDEFGIKIFQTKDKRTEIQVIVQSESVWLSQKQMSELFEKDSDTIGLHLRNIYKSGELTENATTEKYSVVRKEGNRNVNRAIKLYNLDAIISVGYKVNSKRGVQFRIWANQVIKDYLINGFAINEKILKAQIANLNSLKETVRLFTKVTEQKKLTNEESEGLLKIVSDYTYALDVLDQYDYHNLKISDTSSPLSRAGCPVFAQDSYRDAPAPKSDLYWSAPLYQPSLKLRLSKLTSARMLR